jgi:spore coat protein A
LSSTRRTFLEQACALALAATPVRCLAQHSMDSMSLAPGDAPPPVQSLRKPMLHSLELPPFVDPLPMPVRLTPGRHRLRIAMREIHVKVHRDVPPTRLWTYAEASSTTPSALSPLIEARTGQPLQIEWINQLPQKHFLPIDHSLHGCGRDIPDVRAVVHLHGARVPSKDDGYPTDWFVPGQSRVCTYPLEQDAATLWYHDHAMGINRLNIYAGLAGMALIHDTNEDSLGLPSGEQEIPLTLYDRNFSTDGQLFYPVSPYPDHPWVPEFYADAILINGKIRPYVEVEPRLYRLRILNAANSRFFALSLSNNLPLHQIGTDQGLLREPGSLKNILLAPAERADILIDLTGYAGENIHLLNGALEVLQFRVAKPDRAISLPSPAPIPAKLREIAPTPESSAIVTRTITLNEFPDPAGNPMVMLLNRKRWHEPVTEQPRLNTTEIWEFVNQTEDTHPMHLHLVRFQILDRRQFDTFEYLMYKKLRFLASATPPEPGERGWKDVVQCPPGAITRIIVRFEGYAGNYLYHCHILEHESNDMMRPFEVIA